MKIIIVAVFCILCFFVSCSEMEIKWTEKFTPAGIGNYRIEDIKASSRGVCVIGSFWNDQQKPGCITGFYSETGDLIWHRIYLQDKAKAVYGRSLQIIGEHDSIIGEKEYFIVHAQTINQDNQQNSILLKYDSTGTIQWQYSAKESVGESEVQSYLLVDYAGNFYLTGVRQKENDRYSIFIIKFNSAGQEEYVLDYNKPYFQPPVLFDVKEPDQIIVASTHKDQDDIFFMRFDSLGNFQTTKTYRMPDRENLLADLKVDQQGNVYLTGVSASEETGKDYLTLVYNTQDSLLWARRFDGPAHLDDSPRAITYDPPRDTAILELTDFSDSTSSEGTGTYSTGEITLFNVYVTGCSKADNGNTNVITVKYDQNGDQKWTRKFIGRTKESAEPSEIFTSYKYLHTPSYYTIIGSVGDDAVIMKYGAEGFLSWFIRFHEEDYLCLPKAFSRKYLAVQGISVDHEAGFIIKIGKSEQLGIIRWD